MMVVAISVIYVNSKLYAFDYSLEATYASRSNPKKIVLTKKDESNQLILYLYIIIK